jgi:hypothetical protein
VTNKKAYVSGKNWYYVYEYGSYYSVYRSGTHIGKVYSLVDAFVMIKADSGSDEISER